MNNYKIDNFIKGWFIGNFTPSLYKTENFEICYKKFTAGDKESKHLHKIATEYTLVTQGVVTVNGMQYIQGDIIVAPPNYAVEFAAITDAAIVAVKIPCVPNDKYEVP